MLTTQFVYHLIDFRLSTHKGQKYDDLNKGSYEWNKIRNLRNKS